MLIILLLLFECKGSDVKALSAKIELSTLYLLIKFRMNEDEDMWSYRNKGFVQQCILA